MKILTLPAKFVAVLTTSLVVAFAFQNCSPVRFTASVPVDGVDLAGCDADPSLCPPTSVLCTFNGVKYGPGQTVTAFLLSSVPFGQTCRSEVRTCVEGSFTGSYPFATCSEGGASSCLFDGKTIPHGQSVDAYRDSSVAYGATCAKESRTCNNGVLSGSYSYGHCTVGGAASCLFNGQTVAHGGIVRAYQNSSVAYGQSCQSENRQCDNGVLSGSYAHASCSVGAAASCLFNGQTVPHGGTVTAFQSSSVSAGQACVSEVRSCSNGVLSGSFQFPGCAVNAYRSCTFNGQTIAHGGTVTAFATSTVAYGQTCSSQVRTCNDGTLSGSYIYANCSAGSPASCNFNGQTISHGGVVTAYAAPTVPFGSSCAAQTRVCNDGYLSGSYSYSSCSANSASACNFNGQSIPHGGSVTAYASGTVPFGQSCSAETRWCNNGSLSGSYGAASCSVAPGASCNWYGTIVSHGNGALAYAATSVPYGQSCASEWRVCNNGSFTGSYGAASCSVQPAAGCTVTLQGSCNDGQCWNETIALAHGQTGSYYARQNGGRGSGECPSSYKTPTTCNNGSLSNSGPFYSTCYMIEAGSPLMVHFNSDIEKNEPLVFTSPIDGIDFDLLGLNAKPIPHTPLRISWYRSPQYFFITLPNEKGEVKGIDQLFGDNTQGPDGQFAKDGYKALAKFDGMSADGKKRLKAADGYITKADAIFSKLRMWHDANFDGVAQADELFTLDQKNVEVIDLNADPNYSEVDQFGNETALKSVVKTTDGRYHLMFDIWFAYRK